MNRKLLLSACFMFAITFGSSQAKEELEGQKSEKQAEVDANYIATIADADKLFNSGKLEDSKTKYEAALTIKEEQYPKDKIAEIAAKLVELSDASAAAEAQEKIDDPCHPQIL